MEKKSTKVTVLAILLIIAILVIAVLIGKIVTLNKLNEKEVCGVMLEQEVKDHKNIENNFFKNFASNLKNMPDTGIPDYDANVFKLKPEESMTNIGSINISRNQEATLNFELDSKLHKEYPDGYKVNNIINAFYTRVGNADDVEIDLITNEGKVLTVNKNKEYNENVIEINENKDLKDIVFIQRVDMDKVYVDINGQWIYSTNINK